MENDMIKLIFCLKEEKNSCLFLNKRALIVIKQLGIRSEYN